MRRTHLHAQDLLQHLETQRLLIVRVDSSSSLHWIPLEHQLQQRLHRLQQRPVSIQKEVRDSLQTDRLTCRQTASPPSPAQVVGVGQVCGELDFSVHLLYSHDVFGSFVSDSARPGQTMTLKARLNFHVLFLSEW